ncbi:hypothetical protein [Priestia megaterium]
MNYNNPAKSLYEFLYKAHKISSGHSNFQRTWSSIFKIKENDTYSLFENYQALVDLYKKTRVLIMESKHDLLSLPKKIEKNEKTLDLIKLGLTTLNFEGDMSKFHKHITSEVLVSLDHLADEIDYIYEIKDSEIDQEQIDSYLEQVDSLLSDILESSLPTDIRVTIHRNLSSIRNALINYHFYGIDGLHTALEQNIGSLYLNQEEFKSQMHNSSVGGFIRIVNNLKAALETITVGKTLTDPLIKHLLKQ